jgi:hypothetical protein
LGFLFVGGGDAEVRATEVGGASHSATLAAGDAVRLAHIEQLDVSGAAELVFWDVPPLSD